MNSAPAGSETKESPAAAQFLYGGYGRLGAEAAGGYAANPIGRYNAPVGSETKDSNAAAPILYSGSGGLGAVAAGGAAEGGYAVHPIGRRDVHISTEEEAEKEKGADNDYVKKTEKKGKKTKKVAATSTV